MQKVLNKKLKLDRAPEVVRKACELGILCDVRIYCRIPAGADRRMWPKPCVSCWSYISLVTGMRLNCIFACSFLSGEPIVRADTETPLPLTNIYRIFPFTRPLRLIWSSSKKYPQVFSTLYHYVPEHLDREFFVRVTYLMLNLLHMRYTAFLLLRDVKLGFPESLLERIADLELPSDNIFSHLGDSQSLLAVSAFVRQVVNELGFETTRSTISSSSIWPGMQSARLKSPTSRCASRNSLTTSGIYQ